MSRFQGPALIACALGFFATPALGQCNPQTSGPDVIVGDCSGIENYAPVGSIDAFAVGTTSCNVGNQTLMWSSGTANHPVIPQNLYRLKTVDGAARFEQIGQSWMKHGFAALAQNLCCNCINPGTQTLLGVGCSDPYTPERNGDQFPPGGLGPRFQTNPHNGQFIYPYMFRNTTAGLGAHTSITRRLQVHFDDLNPALNAGASYFWECHYVTPDDAAHGNQDNNVSYRGASITAFGNPPTNFGGAVTGTTQRMKPAIMAWKVADPSVTETIINTPEVTGFTPAFDTTGRAILSAKATDVGGGVWQYEYALYNMNSDRAFKGFSIPADGTITSIGFHDVAYQFGDGFNSTTAAPTTFDGSDWVGTEGGGDVTWNMPVATPAENSNALRWGTLYNFRFRTNRPPTTGNATLTMFKTSATLANTIQASTVVPTPLPDCPADINNDGSVDVDDLIAVILSWGCVSPPPCEADVDGNGTVDVDDLIAVILAWGPC
jgi:hypothetical protein